MRFKDEELDMIREMSRQNVETKVMMGAVRDKFPDNVSSARTFYNARAKIKREGQCGETPMQVLFGVLEKHHYLYDTFVDEETNTVEAVFFVHPTSYTLWRAFPQVLMIDSTYKTNQYRMPFIQMVGVTSTLKSFCVAHAFVMSEIKDVYRWVLKKLDDKLDGDELKPRVIVTDRDLALVGACKTVFPHATKLLCRWHIFENIKKHCRPTFGTDVKAWSEFEHRWTSLIKSSDAPTYKRNYDLLFRLLCETKSSKSSLY